MTKANLQEWINETASAEAGPSHSPTKAQFGVAVPAKLTAERVAALQRKWVRVPGDSSKAAIPCPICKEVFKSEWSEEEEEWVWRNALDVNGTVRDFRLELADEQELTTYRYTMRHVEQNRCRVP